MSSNKLIVHLMCLTSISIIAPSHTVAYKILGVFPTSSRSHFMIGEALMKGLAAANHNVTVLSPFPQIKPIKNYHDVTFDLINMKEIAGDKIQTPLDIPKLSIWESITLITQIGIKMTNLTLSHEITQKLINSGDKYDIVIIESFFNEAMLGFGPIFNASIISMSTFGASDMTNEMVGSPSPLSYVPNGMLNFTDRMTFWQRFINTIVTTLNRFIKYWFYWPKQQELYDKLFPNPKPSLDEIRRNVALVLLNSHFSISYPRPYVPNMIEVGGLHIDSIIRPLPTDVQEFLDSSGIDGVIYFSMGSNLNSADLPNNKRDAILNTFSKLNQKILWKWENEILPNKPENVLFNKWFPQNDILSHSNVRLFITHGGLLSTSEAIYHGIPIIGIPIFGDQNLNMAKAVQGGYGLTVPYVNLNEQTLSEAISEMLENDQYSKNAKEFSKRFHDRPLNPLQTAIYWIEYVARHKGAKHLHSAGQDLHWIAYHNLDVFAGILFVMILLKKLLVGIFYRKRSVNSIIEDNKKIN